MTNQSISRALLALMIFATGCNATNFLTAKKQPGNANQSGSTSVVGSPDIANSQKVKDPVKIHLAWAVWNEYSKNFHEAHNQYLKVLEKSPKNAEAMLGLARIDREFGRDKEADAWLKKVVKLHPRDPQVLLAIGQMHASRNEWPEALDNIKAAHELAPFETNYEYYLAVTETYAGEIQSAIGHFTRSVGQAEAYYNVGYILNEQGKSEEAQTYLINALKLKPDLKQAETALTAIRTRNSDEVQPASFNEKIRH